MWRPASLLLLLLTALPAGAGQLYCCQDTHGHKVCGDTVPPLCQKRGYQELNPQGVVTRQVEGQLTPEQQARRAAELEKQKAQDQAAKEQKRKDQALLNMYASVQDIQEQQTRSQQDITLQQRQLQGRLNEALKRRTHLQNEAEFYRNKPMPPDLTKQVKDNGYDIRSLQDQLNQKRQELGAANARYEADRKRYQELISGHNGELHPALAPH